MRLEARRALLTDHVWAADQRKLDLAHSSLNPVAAKGLEVLKQYDPDKFCKIRDPNIKKIHNCFVCFIRSPLEFSPYVPYKARPNYSGNFAADEMYVQVSSHF